MHRLHPSRPPAEGDLRAHASYQSLCVDAPQIDGQTTRGQEISPMTAHVILLGIGSFSVCLLFHVILWQFRRPYHHALALFGIFFLGGGFLLMVSAFLMRSLSGTDWLAIGLMHVALSCGYIQLYPASQANSPSVTLLMAVRKSMPAGLTDEDIHALFETRSAVHPPSQKTPEGGGLPLRGCRPLSSWGGLQDRVEELVVSGLVQDEAGQLSLTHRGRAFISPFIYFRKMLGIPEGKG